MKQKKATAARRSVPGGRKPFWPGLIVMAVCYVLLTLGMILATSPERYNLSVGDIAPTTITATKDVVDEFTTEQRRIRAAENVPLSYREDETAHDRVMNTFSDIFLDFEAIRVYGEKLRIGEAPSASGNAFTYSGTFLPEDLEYARSMCEAMELSDWTLTILMKTSAYDLSGAYKNTSEILERTMQSTIREGQLETAITAIQRELPQYMSTELCWNIAIPAVRAALVPNMVVDQDATEANREAARHDIEPDMYKSGQNIVVGGEGVTQAQLGMLEILGLLEGNRFDTMMMVGVGLLGALAMVALLFHILQFDRGIAGKPRSALLLAVIFAVSIGICVLTSRLNVTLIPISMVVLLVATLLSPSLAVICNILALIVVGILTNSTSASFTQQMLGIIFSGALSGPVGIFVARRKQQRASILLAGLAIAVVNLFAMISLGLLTNNEFNTVLTNAVWCAGGGVLAAILCMGVQPMLEWMFDLVTPYKLLELSNPNQPLLRRLLVETPGTYHHSIMVANLAEAAAEAIGADSLLTRVGAYYHDIGKLTRPLYFKENQIGDNPHDRTDPRVSAAIIADHVTDGIQMAHQQHLPEAITAFIAQHQGDTQISFFYQKMRGMEGGEGAQPEDFQYPGPKPQTAETAILMLADTVEAAIRAGGDQAPEVIERRIRELVKDKIDGGQLNDSPLRFADVSKIIRAFAQVLTGIYHKRIEYPKLDRVAALPAIPKPVETVPVIEVRQEDLVDAAIDKP